MNDRTVTSTSPERPTWPPRLSRRQLLRAGATLVGGACTAGLVACRERYIEIPRIIEKEVIKVVTEIVRETVIVPATPEATAPEPALPSPVPPVAPEAPQNVILDTMHHGWNTLAQRMAPTFQELFPGRRLIWRSSTPWPQYSSRIATLAAADDLGDIIEAPLGTVVQQWAASGILSPMDELVHAEGYDLQGVFEGALSQAIHRERLYGIPFVAHPGDCLVLVNNELVPTESVLDDRDVLLLDFAQAIEKELDGAGLLYWDDLALPAAFGVLGAFGARWLNAWGTQATLHTPATIGALEWMAAFRRSGLTPPVCSLPRPPERLYALDELAVLRTSFAGLWLLQRTGMLPSQTQFGLMPLDEAGSGDLEGVAYCLTRSCQNPSLALQWIKFMTTREMGVQMLLAGYGAPGARLAAWTDSRVIEYMPACARLGERCAKTSGIRLPWNLATNACFEAWNQRLGALLEPGTAVDQWARETARAITEVLSMPREEAIVL